MANLKLSLIIAAYNEGEKLKNFFRFWLNQDYDNYEIIIVNDGSIDNTKEIVLYYKKKYGDKIVLVNNNKNKGVGYTRYSGFLHARGDIIKFSDADIAKDLPFQKDLISRLMEPFNNDSKVDVVYIDYYPFFSNKNIVRDIENFYYVSPVLNTPKNYKYTNKLSGHMPTLFRKKDIDLKKISSIKNGEDRFIASQFLKSSRKNGKSKGVFIFDGQIKSIFPMLYKRYLAYGKNSLGFLKISKRLFLFHILKPTAVVGSLLLLLLGFILGKLYFLIPFFLIYFLFFFLTLSYCGQYIKKESKILILKIILLGPIFLMMRYIFVFYGIIVKTFTFSLK